jgi:hypothetical protein
MLLSFKKKTLEKSTKTSNIRGTVREYLELNNFVYEDEDVKEIKESFNEKFWNKQDDKSNVKVYFRLIFYTKLNCEFEKFMQHKKEEGFNQGEGCLVNSKATKYEFNILFNDNITKDKMIGQFHSKQDPNVTYEKKIFVYEGEGDTLETKLKNRIDNYVDDIKNDKKLSNEKIFNLIVFLIDIIEYYKLTYDYKKVIKEILSTSPKETSFVFFSADINEESLTKYVAENYKTGEYQKYLPLIFNEEPKPAADGRRKSKRRSKKRSKRRSSRRKSKRRSKKSKKRY